MGCTPTISMTDKNFVTVRQADDPEILKASQQAQNTFRHFWHQVAIDFNRIVPALELASLKASFSDNFGDPNSPVEQMWVDRLDFDGVLIYGVLLNNPNWLTSVKQGDKVSFPLSQLNDWLCMLGGEVYGGHTIQVIRSRMNDDERTQHDEAWGLSFPSSDKVLIPDRDLEVEKAIADLMIGEIEQDPEIAKLKFDGGRTLLHLESLYGKPHSVKALLEMGASAEAKCDRGWTPLDYAKVLDWKDVISLLEKRA